MNDRPCCNETTLLQGRFFIPASNLTKIKMKRLLVLLCLLHIPPVALSAGKVIKVGNMGSEDCTETIRKIFEANPTGNFSLEFDPGTYHFYPEKATGKYIRISNNDNGYKRVVFDISRMENVSVAGSDTGFIFYGGLVPFNICDSRNISVSGISIDYDHSFVFEGEVVARNAEANSVDVRIGEDVEYSVRGDRFFFSGYDWEMPLGEYILFDRQTRSPYYNTARFNHHNRLRELTAKEIGERMVRFCGFMNELPPTGSIIVDKGPHGMNRRYPGFIIHHSSDILLHDVDLHMAGAMGVIGENSENISMRRFNVRLREDSERMISSSADATHFVNCRGTVLFEDCVFQNMLDDATNIHGTYMKVVKAEGRELSVQFGHYQQQGFDFVRKGDKLRLTDRGSLCTVGYFNVAKVEWINENYAIIHSEEDLPVFDTGVTLAVDNPDNLPSLIMRGCRVSNNRARSILISTSKPVLVENNYFESMMAGILIAGDANNWYESGPVADVVIRGNEFVNIGRGGENPQSVLQISPEIPRENRHKGYYHGRIVFENNTVNTFESQVIYGLSVSELVIRNNRFVENNDFAPIFPGLPYMDLQNCGKVDIFGNMFEGTKEAEVSVLDCEDVVMKRQKGFNNSVITRPNTFFYQQ
jgi:hypothetical protein